MQFTRPVWIHLTWKIGKMEQALRLEEVEEWVVEGGPIPEQVVTGETWEVTEPTTRVTKEEQTVVALGSEAQGLEEVAVVASGQELDLEACSATCLETGLEVAMGGTTGAMAAITGVGVEVFGAEIGRTIMEAVLDGEVLPREDGEEEGHPLEVGLQALVQGLLQALEAPEGVEVKLKTIYDESVPI